MSTTMSRDEVAARIDRGGVTVIEALPASHYEEAHLPGAINLPHDQVDELAPGLLPDRQAEIVVYCSNHACQNSTIAAKRLTELGYVSVFDYEAGKQDWIDAGLPTESGQPASAGGGPTRSPVSAPTAPTREVGGVELPQAGTWKVDPGHAEVGFVGRHFMLTRIRGRFVEVDATVEVADRIEESQVEATIGMASVDTGDTTRDDHLRSSDLFDVDTHPTATFRSTQVEWNGRTGTLTGDLTIRSVSRPIELDVELLGVVVDPWDSERAILDARGRINREDWGVTWNMVLESGGLLVSKEIDLVLHLELVRP